MSRKVFCIGFNKTGTSSLHNYFLHHNMTSLHNMIWQEATHYLEDQALKNFLSEFQAFSDGEMANVERIVDLYPDAVYIVNTRELYSWLRSRIKWVFRNHPKKANGPMAQEYNRLGHAAIPIWIDRRNAYYAKLETVFAKRSIEAKWLNVCSDPDWVMKLDGCLGLSTDPDQKFHNNKQTLSEMNETKKELLDMEFAQIMKTLEDRRAASEKDTEGILSNAKAITNCYSIRLDLSHLVARRFGEISLV